MGKRNSNSAGIPAELAASSLCELVGLLPLNPFRGEPVGKAPRRHLLPLFKVRLAVLALLLIVICCAFAHNIIQGKQGYRRSVERRRCSNGYKFGKAKLAKATAVGEVITSSLCELAAPHCGAGLPKGGGGIPAVRTFRQWVLTVRACTVFFWRCAAASKPVLLGLGCGSCSYIQKKVLLFCHLYL